MLLKYGLNVESLDVSYRQRLPDGIAIESGQGFAGLKQTRLFRSSGSPSLRNLQHELKYHRSGFEGAGPNGRYVLGFYIEFDNRVVEREIAIQPDQWWDTRYFVKYNTPGQADGVFQLWVNGTQLANERNVQFTPDVASRPDGLMIGGNFSHGGVAPDRPFRRWIDDIKVIVNQPSVSLPVLLAVDIGVPEGQSGTQQLKYELKLSQPATSPVTVDFATRPHVATPEVDYVSKRGTITFNPGETSKFVTIDIKGDTFVEANEFVILDLSNIRGATLARNEVWGTIQNDDSNSVRIDVSPTTGLTTTEAKGTVSFNVVLSVKPTANVVIDVVSTDTTEGRPDKSKLTFTPSNWNRPQTVKVTGVDDRDDDGDIAYAISLAPAISNDSRYSGVNPTDPQLINVDNDEPPPPPGKIVVTPTSGLTTTENGGTAAFTVVLDSRPTSNVTIDVGSTDTTEGRADKSKLTFTPSNWNRPQTVKVTGINDSDDDGDVAYAISLAPSKSGDARFSGINPADPQMVNVDNDDPVLPGSILVTPTSGLTTTENGGTATFTVVLGSQPTSNVTIDVSSSDTTEGRSDKTSLTFTPSNWNRTQVITVSGVDDLEFDGDVAYQIILGPARATDPRFNRIDPADVQLANRDVETFIQFVAQYSNSPGDGFNNVVFGLQRRAAFEHALRLWSQQLPASYAGETIVVAASTLSAGTAAAGGSFLASAGPTSLFENFRGAVPNTLYSVALANHIAKQDLNGSQPEISVTVNEDIDVIQIIVGTGGFHYQTDGQPGTKYDFVSVIMHEIAHGLGFLSNLNSDGSFGRGPSGAANPTIWDRFLEIGNGSDLTTLTPRQRAQALVSSDLFWNGNRALQMNGTQRPEIFAPSTYLSGSSTSHLDEASHSNQLLSPSIDLGEVHHRPNGLELGILADMGWMSV